MKRMLCIEFHAGVVWPIPAVRMENMKRALQHVRVSAPGVFRHRPQWWTGAVWQPRRTPTRKLPLSDHRAFCLWQRSLFSEMSTTLGRMNCVSMLCDFILNVQRMARLLSKLWLRSHHPAVVCVCVWMGDAVMLPAHISARPWAWKAPQGWRRGEENRSTSLWFTSSTESSYLSSARPKLATVSERGSTREKTEAELKDFI